MNNIWKRWEPKIELKNKYYIDTIKDEDNLIIELSDEVGTEKIIMRWDGCITSYTCTEESSRSILYDNNELTKWTFFKVENSQYLKWIEYQSLGIEQGDKLIHYCIIGINSVVDIIARYDPEISLVLNENN